MALPTEKTKPKTDIKDYSVLIYGQSKIGKSTFCANSPNALFLAAEPGLNALDVYQVSIRSWVDMLNACSDIINTNHNFETIVIDTIDNVFRFCSNYVCEKNKIDHLADLKQSKGYTLAHNEFHRVLTKLAHLPYGLFLVSHSTEKMVDTRTGKFTKTVPTLPGKASSIALDLVDIIMYCDIETTKDKDGNTVDSRVVRVEPSQFYEAGDRTNKLSGVIPLNYTEFVKNFNGGK